jgi:eukaryotic-like serine/threonine-protein kinase
MTNEISKAGTLSLAPAQAPIVLPFLQGDIIAGKYEVLGLTGSGGVGYVISARHVELGELVALKFLRPQALAHKELVARFAREARAAARIKSEYVARVYDVGTLPSGEPFIVMEHLEGQDLGSVMKQSGPLPIARATECIMQACEGLASAHALGVIHRDVKPGNLFLARRALGMETVKVLDFGISKVALGANSPEVHQAFVQTTMLMGSPSYMSPEQIRACDEVDQRTDIWSLGCVLFELLTANCVFNAPTLMQLSAAILERTPVPLKNFLPDAPEGLQAVVAKCLEKDPRNRFQNVAELAVALFPFAPPRARLSAERCVLLVNRPPSAPASFDAESLVVDSTRSAPSTNSPTVLSMYAGPYAEPASERPQAIALNSNIPLPRPPMLSFGEMPSFRPRHRRAQVLATTAGALALAGYFVWKDLRPAPPKQVTSSLQRQLALPLPSARAPEAEVAAPTPADSASAALLATPPSAVPSAELAPLPVTKNVPPAQIPQQNLALNAAPLASARAISPIATPPATASINRQQAPAIVSPKSNTVRPKSNTRQVLRVEDEPDVGF